MGDESGPRRRRSTQLSRPHSMPIGSAAKHLVTPTDIADQEEQQHCVKDPDGFGSSYSKEKNSVHEIDDPTEHEKRNSPFRLDKSRWDERKEPCWEQVNQRPKADINREQRRGPGGGVEDDSNSKRNTRSCRHGFVLSRTRSSERAAKGQTNVETTRVLMVKTLLAQNAGPVAHSLRRAS